MTEPRTLLQTAGAPGTSRPMATSTVVTIDAQTEYLSGSVPLSGINRALDKGTRRPLRGRRRRRG